MAWQASKASEAGQAGEVRAGLWLRVYIHTIGTCLHVCTYIYPVLSSPDLIISQPDGQMLCYAMQCNDNTRTAIMTLACRIERQLNVCVRVSGLIDFGSALLY